MPPTRGGRGRLLFGLAAALAIAVLATWLVAFSPVLGVRTVTVRGATGSAAEQVRDAAQLNSGTPLVRVDTAAVAHRIEALPQVARARVHTSFPSTVVIEVTERQAVGMIVQPAAAGERYVLVDPTGAQFRTVTSAPAGVPRFVVPEGANARDTGAALARVAAALPAQLRAQVASIEALHPDAITLVLSDRRVVRWGSAEHGAAKARVLAALLAPDAGGPPATQFDVSDPDQPFTR